MMLSTNIDEKWMHLALSLSKRTRGSTWPNPNVGCVIVKDNILIGRGWTAAKGRPHAEIQALKSTTSNPENSTVYVTLEPCSHIGQTQPCITSLINAKVARVVIATRDLDPRVAGKGIRFLKDAGISVTEGILEEDARYEHLGFFNRILNNQPKITIKFATSLDSKISTQSNESKWITSEKSRKLTHFYRMQNDAIMVGSGTVIMDDPMLNVRHIKSTQQPVRIVIDTELRTPLNSKIFQSAKEFNTIICCATHTDKTIINTWIDQGARVLKCDLTSVGEINLNSALNQISDIGINNVFCEGGAKLATNLIKQNLVHEFISMTSGLLIGSTGNSFIKELENLPLSKLPSFKLKESFKYGDDSVSIWHKP